MYHVVSVVADKSRISLFEAAILSLDTLDEFIIYELLPLKQNGAFTVPLNPVEELKAV